MKWLSLDDLDAVKPDPNIFSELQRRLATGSSPGVEAFILDILLENRPWSIC